MHRIVMKRYIDLSNRVNKIRKTAGRQLLGMRERFGRKEGIGLNQIEEQMSACMLCPRECRANRLQGNTGYCRQTAELRVARAALHFWEEPCLSGEHGSGAVFFTGCQVGCIFCQNADIAAGKIGKTVTIERLIEIFLNLQEQGAHNINLVTPTHFVPQIVVALQEAKKQGMHLPVIYNTSSYEKVETLRLLEGLVDIYLPDMKYRSAAVSARYSHASDYFEVACAAIAEMVRQVGEPAFDSESGLMQKGVIVRHLVLPGFAKDSKQVIRYLYETYGERIFISIMNQYTPLEKNLVPKQNGVGGYMELNRKVTEEEYDSVVDYAIDLGVENGFIQEGETAEESFIPEFDLEGV